MWWFRPPARVLSICAVRPLPNIRHGLRLPAPMPLRGGLRRYLPAYLLPRVFPVRALGQKAVRVRILAPIFGKSCLQPQVNPAHRMPLSHTLDCALLAAVAPTQALPAVFAVACGVIRVIRTTPSPDAPVCNCL